MLIWSPKPAKYISTDGDTPVAWLKLLTPARLDGKPSSEAPT